MEVRLHLDSRTTYISWLHLYIDIFGYILYSFKDNYEIEKFKMSVFQAKIAV